MVVFEQGTPNKKFYRRFNIKTVVGPDDFASMEEVLFRRFRRWKSIQESDGDGKKIDQSFGILPDLLVVDGGKGQLSRATKVLHDFGLDKKIVAAGLAKEHELLFLPGKDVPIKLPRNSQGLFLLQRIRDEAHRFAITAHRNLRKKEKFISRLDQIPGIGPVRKKELLKKFGSLNGVKNALISDMVTIHGITRELAVKIHAELTKT